MKYFVTHSTFGLGKTEDALNGLIQVQFLSGEKCSFAADALAEGDIRRVRLPLKTFCQSSNGRCTVEEVLAGLNGAAAARYRVVMENGLRAEASEEDLWPIKTDALVAAEPVDLLGGLDHGSYKLFSAREQLVDAVERLARSSGGLSSIHSSRIDLRPHQAFVAGVVLLDSRRRYLLADEVGLGKTIEAGIIIHDLLHRKPNARILVVCPPALTQQWLCELYSKFGGQTFILPELRAPNDFNWATASRVILGFTDLVCSHAQSVTLETWDLVVIDEVHHLVDSDPLYETVFPVAKSAESLLLLSALPARRREDELLRLLRLLEPDRFADITDDVRSRFADLFESQTTIGRKLNLLKRRLNGIAKGEFTLDEAREKAAELLALQVFDKDDDLHKRLQSCPDDPNQSEEQLRQLMKRVGERYRINRRIIRNRRDNLIAQEELQAIRRRLVPHQYQPDQIEIDVFDAVRSVLEEAHNNELDSNLLELLTQVLWQSLGTPKCAESVITQMVAAGCQKLNTKGTSYLQLGHLNGYTGWKMHLRLLATAVKPKVSSDCLLRLSQAVDRWGRQGTPSRLKKLKEILQNRARRQDGVRPKMLVFAGFPGIATEVAQFLNREFGEKSVGEFRWDMDRESKELSVREFRHRPERWLLVSDETGGEGRNFQFANELVHLDTPWQVSRVEQRIGRLDRLGRELENCSDVISNVISCERSVEAGLIDCFAQGLGVYEKSISGLEFGLRNAEHQIAVTAARSGLEGLTGLIPTLSQDAEAERVRDEGEILLDEASFNRSAAQAFRRVKNADELERNVEDAFYNYVELTGKKPIEVRDDEFPGCIFKYRTDAFRQIELRNTLGDACVGTFRRNVAQQRLDLQFFTIGNPFFDDVCKSFREQACGRTYAIEVNIPSIDPWAGFEFVFTPDVKASDETSSFGLFNRIEALFATEPVHVFCSVAGHSPDTEQWLTLRRSILPRDKDFTWSNLTKEKSRRLHDVFGRTEWPSLVGKLSRLAESVARKQIEDRLGVSISDELLRLDQLIEELAHDLAPDAEIETVRGWQQSLRSWGTRLDAVGFLSINGWLTQRGSR